MAMTVLGGGSSLEVGGVVVNGVTVRETERRDFADGLAVRYVLPRGERRGNYGVTPH